jgi:hypothetical protein
MAPHLRPCQPVHAPKAVGTARRLTGVECISKGKTKGRKDQALQHLFGPLRGALGAPRPVEPSSRPPFSRAGPGLSWWPLDPGRPGAGHRGAGTRLRGRIAIDGIRSSSEPTPPQGLISLHRPQAKALLPRPSPNSRAAARYLELRPRGMSLTERVHSKRAFAVNSVAGKG